jgi:hypothetical protein
MVFSWPAVYIYSCVVGALAVAFALQRLVASFLYHPLVLFFLKHLAYPIIIRRHKYIGPISPLRLLLQGVHGSASVISTVYGSRSVTASIKATGLVSVVHLFPLFLGNHLGTAADVLGLSLRTYRLAHGWIGLTSIVFAIPHIVLGTMHLKNVHQTSIYFALGVSAFRLTGSNTDRARRP